MLPLRPLRKKCCQEPFFGAEAALVAVDEIEFPFPGREQQGAAACHDLLLDPEKIIPIDHTVVFREIDTRGIFPGWRSGIGLGFRGYEFQHVHGHGLTVSCVHTIYNCRGGKVRDAGHTGGVGLNGEGKIRILHLRGPDCLWISWG